MSFAKWRPFCLGLNVLTDWGPVMLYHMVLETWVIVGSDNGLPPFWLQATTCMNFDLWSIRL